MKPYIELGDSFIPRRFDFEFGKHDEAIKELKGFLEPPVKLKEWENEFLHLVTHCLQAKNPLVGQEKSQRIQTPQSAVATTAEGTISEG